MYYVNVTHAFTSSHFSSVQFHVLVATEIPLGLSPVGSVAHGVICGVAMVRTRPCHRPKAAPLEQQDAVGRRDQAQHRVDHGKVTPSKSGREHVWDLRTPVRIRRERDGGRGLIL